MSGDSDRDHSDDLNGPYVQAACVDCGRDILVDYDPDGALCDECCELRETWALTTERRMAKADLKDRQGPAVVDVALVPIVQPAGYLPWLDSLRANARYGSDALARAWYVSDPQYIQHLITVCPALWATLKAIASRRVA
jgi:hypothetical protein